MKAYDEKAMESIGTANRTADVNVAYSVNENKLVKCHEESHVQIDSYMFVLP